MRAIEIDKITKRYKALRELVPLKPPPASTLVTTRVPA